MQKSLILLASAVITALALSFAVLLHAAGREDEREAQRSRQQVEAALAAEIDRLVAAVRDYAVWNEAADRIGPVPDLDWIEANFNALTIDNHALSSLLVVGPDGALLARAAGGGADRADRGAVAMPPWAQPLLDRVRTAADTLEAQAGGFVLVDGVLTAVSASLVADEEGGLRLPADRAPVVLFVRALDAEALARIQERAGVTGLRHGTDVAAAVGQLVAALEGADGGGAGALSWSPGRPGRDLIAGALPWLSMGGIAILVATALLLMRIADTTRSLETANRGLKAASDESRSIGDAAPFPLAVIRLTSGEIVFANREMRTLLGLADERPAGVTVPDFLSDPGLLEQLFEQDAALGDTLSRQTVVNGPEEAFPAEVAARRGSVGGEAMLILTVRDLRPEIEAARIRRIAEERLLRAEADRARTTILEVETRLLRPLLFELVTALLASRDAREALLSVAQTARQAVRGQATVLARATLADGAALEVILDGGHGGAAELLAPFADRLAAEDLEGPILAGGSRSRRPGQAAPKPFRTVVAVPLPGLAGGLVLASEEPDAFSDGDLEVLQALAGTVVIALRARPGDARTAPKTPRRRIKA